MKRQDNVSLLGIKVDPVTVEQVHDYIDDCVRSGERSLVLNVNVHCVNLACEHHWLKGLLNDAGLVFCDGAGVRLGLRLLGHRIPPRITYADWMWQLAAHAEHVGHSLYFLGGEPEEAGNAARALLHKHPNLKIVGTQHGYFDKTTTSLQNQDVIEAINKVKPAILVLGMGMPLQERWFSENWTRLNATVGLSGGAVFGYVAGRFQRGPRWMTSNGLEWLARLWFEPKRLWRRYLVGNPLFLARVVRQRLGVDHYTMD
jgi:N-acetylglucosaminyldiphosphoundecaprenol N-acetyl-beta-D-mannosaminyltransferase